MGLYRLRVYLAGIADMGGSRAVYVSGEGNRMNAERAIEEIVQEFGRATATNGAFHSAHEGYAVIAEELDELWAEVKKKSRDRDPERMRKEASQIAAMGLRFMVDLL